MADRLDACRPLRVGTNIYRELKTQNTIKPYFAPVPSVTPRNASPQGAPLTTARVQSSRGSATRASPPSWRRRRRLQVRRRYRLARGLEKLKESSIDLDFTQITDAGCAALAAALDNGVLPALETLGLGDIPASAAAKDAVREALAKSRAAALP